MKQNNVHFLSHHIIEKSSFLLYDDIEVTDMSGIQTKKMLILNILEILKKYTNETDPKTYLTQKEIGNLLLQEYGMTADRKAIRRNLTDLMEAG
jgi:hypothetical protein